MVEYPIGRPAFVFESTPVIDASSYPVRAVGWSATAYPVDTGFGTVGINISVICANVS